MLAVVVVVVISVLSFCGMICSKKVSHHAAIYCSIKGKTSNLRNMYWPPFFVAHSNCMKKRRCGGCCCCCCIPYLCCALCWITAARLQFHTWICIKMNHSDWFLWGVGAGDRAGASSASRCWSVLIDTSHWISAGEWRARVSTFILLYDSPIH